MNKVTLKQGQVHCDRCGGNRIFYTRVHNGQGVPAQPDKGICYRCKGSGVDPYLKAPIDEKKPIFTSAQRTRFINTFNEVMKETGDGVKSIKYKDIKDVNALNTLINTGFIVKFKDSGATYITPTSRGIERYQHQMETIGAQ